MIHTLIKLYRRLRYARYGWFGNYSSWEEASKKGPGYNGEDIFQKVRAATLQVQQGKAVYERDGVLFDKIEYSWPLIANLLWIYTESGNRLSVVDFGGSLGSSYFQNRKYLENLAELKWKVVEQGGFVTVGQNDIADGQLSFYYSIEEALEEGSGQVLLLSCVLPYLEEPLKFLRSVLSFNFPYIIIDNTYFNPKPGNRLTIQKVPPLYYKASYPAWFLDYQEVEALMSKDYEVIASHTNEQFLYFYGEKINYRGTILRRKK